jgi:hypothetical protein
VPGPAPGFLLSGGAGYAPQVARFVTDGATDYRARHSGWVGAGAGGRWNLGRGALGLSWRGALHGLSGMDGPGCDGVAACEPWLWFAQALVFEQRVTLGRRGALRIAEDLDISALDADGRGVRPAVSLGLTVGLEVGL